VQNFGGNMIIGVGYSPTKRIKLNSGNQYVKYNLKQEKDEKIISSDCEHCDLFVEGLDDDCIECFKNNIYWKYKRV